MNEPLDDDADDEPRYGFELPPDIELVEYPATKVTPKMLKGKAIVRLEAKDDDQ